MVVWQSQFLSTWGGQRGIKATLFDPGRWFSCASPCCSQECSWECFCKCKAHTHTQGGGIVPCSLCFAWRCAEEPLCSLRGFRPVCSSPLAPGPRSTQKSSPLMPSPRRGCSVTFVHQQPLPGRQQQQVQAEGCPNTAWGCLFLTPRL